MPKSSLSQDDMTAQIALLYELSLAVGQSLDLKTNCDRFLKTLMSKKSFDYGGVWFKNTQLPTIMLEEKGFHRNPEHLNLIYAHPEYRVQETILPIEHSMAKAVEHQAFFSITHLEPEFKSLITEKHVDTGVYIIIALGEIGYLKLFSSIRTETLSTLEMNQLRHVLSKFTISIKGCIAHKVAVGQAHAIGKAEIATTVLHNIGNVLNSVNISADILHTTLKLSKLDGLLKANGLLEAHEHHLGYFLEQDPQGKVLYKYYQRLGMILKQEQQNMLSESVDLIEKIALIKAIVQNQQAYATQPLFKEPINIACLTEECLKIYRERLEMLKIEVVKHIDSQEQIQAPKAKLGHVLMNLFKNAIEALEDIHDRPRMMTITFGKNQDKQLCLECKDNGIGISAEDSKKIFSHGFSTKSQGHGFGLHYCANAMKEMGGRLDVYSTGLNQGSSFSLTFPEEMMLKK